MSVTLRNSFLPAVLTLVVLSSCRSSAPLINDNFSVSDRSAEEVVQDLPDYRSSLNALTGKGRAIVSEPGNSERITIDFASNTTTSLLNVKNRIGIEAGSMQVRNDSILIYNKIDGNAQLRSVSDASLSGIGELAAVNLIQLLNYTIDPRQVRSVMESETHYLLLLRSGGTVLVSKQDRLIAEVTMPTDTRLPYSQIIYESYAGIDSYTLPRKITIFSADRVSKILFQIRDLTLNPEKLNTELNIPEDITIQRL